MDGITEAERVRDLDWPDCANVRDLGGLPTADGGSIRSGVLIRADSLCNLSEAGVEAFRAAGVSRIVDLRRQVEIDVAPHPFAAEDGYRNIAVQDPADPDNETMTLVQIYTEMLDLRPELFAAAVAAIADAPGGAVVVHCTGGKDRTGLVVAMLLHIAGVDDAVIAADYGLTEHRLAERNRAYLQRVGDERMREIVRRLQATPPEHMLAVLRHLRERYGSVADYLRAGGMTDEQFAALRHRLVVR